MIELGQLERRHGDFAKRNARVIAISVDGTEDSSQTQTRFPHLLVLADQSHGLSNAVDVIHPKAAPDGSDADAPTTILVGPDGKVQWLYRSPQVIAVFSPDGGRRAIAEQTKKCFRFAAFFQPAAKPFKPNRRGHVGSNRQTPPPPAAPPSTAPTAARASARSRRAAL